MIGVVLCGGNSTRMGTDKGLLKEKEETWAAIAARKLQALQLPAIVSINTQQYATYEQIFDKEQLIVDSKTFEVRAPLFGLLSVHLKFPEADSFVLACDIKNMTTDLLRPLLKRYEQGNREAYIYHTGDRPQPLCGIYTASGLGRVYTLFRNGELKRYSMMHMLEVLNTDLVPVNEEDRPFFNNYNTPIDI